MNHEQERLPSTHCHINVHAFGWFVEGKFFPATRLAAARLHQKRRKHRASVSSCSRDENVYTLTGNLGNFTLEIQRSNIVVNGAGAFLRETEADKASS
jgi:hypothetical protein